MSLSSYQSDKNALVLIAEDEAEIAEILDAYLRKSGYRTAIAPNGRIALDLHNRLKPDMLILDVNMPEFDGWEVLSRIREYGETPVIMLTALDQNIDKLMGLRLGADDYVVKPFNAAVVVARVEAILRRARATSASTLKILRFLHLEVNLEIYEASVQVEGQRKRLNLTPTEFKLLARMLQAPRRVFTREELTVHCLQEGDQLFRAVDSHISKLRKKIEDSGIEGVPHSIRGVGYRVSKTV
ncbi:response regulator [Comamonas sp. JUb58]|uniref:response regulator n=1 Tax=Comamonas sp. JUb58 TaxID=2485114 RepID=UPI001062323A|nr:response regulator [Comamonas sp. JUb58]TDS84986.1 winged helix family two component transcriptional regulator [Comamonas sp. JUb58]